MPAGVHLSVPAFLDALRATTPTSSEQTIYPVNALDRALIAPGSSAPSCREYSDPYIFEYYFSRAKTRRCAAVHQLAAKRLPDGSRGCALSVRMITR